VDADRRRIETLFTVPADAPISDLRERLLQLPIIIQKLTWEKAAVRARLSTLASDIEGNEVTYDGHYAELFTKERTRNESKPTSEETCKQMARTDSHLRFLDVQRGQFKAQKAELLEQTQTLEEAIRSVETLRDTLKTALYDNRREAATC